MRPPFLLPDSVISFRDYFRLSAEPDGIAEAFGYSFTQRKVDLPRLPDPLPWVDVLQKRLERLRPKVRLSSETARREFFIAPILLEIADHFDILLRAEFPIMVSPQLRGNLDYYIESDETFLIVEAKNDNLERGASQLVAELIAVERWTTSESPTLYGAVSIGTIWQFVALHRATKRIEQDTALYRVPDELPEICAILLDILKPKPTTSTDQ